MKAFFKGLSMGLGAGIVILASILLFFYIKNEKEPAEPVTSTVQEVPHIPFNEKAPSSNAEPEFISEPFMPEEIIPENVTLAFAGDVQFPDSYLASYDRSGISAIADEEMLTLMREADLFILNEEFPFSLRGEPMEDKQFTFRTDPKYIDIFQELGTDIAVVANNHALDFGQDAFCDTLDTLKQADIASVGGGYNIEEASAPVIREINGQTFAIFAATRVSPSYSWYATSSQPGLFQTYDPALLNEAITAAEELYDHTIVFVHWGIERNETPEEYQHVLARGYIDAGADLIVGCHPHVLQGFEYYKNVPIIYSLGNYLFGNRTGETLLLNATFKKDSLPDIQLIPCQRKNGVLSRIDEPQALFDHLTSLSFDVDVSEDGLLVPVT